MSATGSPGFPPAPVPAPSPSPSPVATPAPDASGAGGRHSVPAATAPTAGGGVDGRVDGGHFHGNFPEYYRFHPSEERLGLLPPFFWESLVPGAFPASFSSEGQSPLRVVDVGCNAGDLSVDFAKRVAGAGAKVSAFGVDIDRGLVERASVLARANDLVDSDGAFRVCDLCRPPQGLGFDKPFDICCCWSSTMWIHLHGGDEGLAAMLTAVHDSLVVGGIFVLEPQPWHCYRRAKERAKKRGAGVFPFPPATLAWNKEGLLTSIFAHLEKIGMTLEQTFEAGGATSKKGGFGGRSIHVFRRTH